ncbi:protease SohB [Fastidiosibacter lacustris]|uniref:protease SohB n=1 Tax=Fastidiosibacter lacustris TaxID=2056695 RepID=UPI000E3573B2|nr:protease SohB [Fastidiosibacter lacustris]
MWVNHAVNYLFFILEVVTVALAIVIVFALIVGLSAKAKRAKKGQLNIKSLNKAYQNSQQQLAHEIFNKTEFKKLQKQHQQAQKLLHKNKAALSNVFVINFNGDIKASQAESLAEEVSAILQVAKPDDEVVVKLESPGGAVNGYGLAAAQLARVKQANLKLTAVIDQVAASGGYMMASVADQIIASPFAIVGSIGVVAQLPNIHRLLSDKGVDVELHTAGKYKRTLTMLGENTEEGRQKFKEELEVVHRLFKEHITHFRNKVEIEKVATGEYWFGQSALELNLVDALMTSDAYLLEKYQTGQYNLFQVEYQIKKSKFAALCHSTLNLFQRVGP